ncbi:hypothetical protein LA080_001566 [Diaporthe eres]|nr:hypothetical protein LA080_001566 [Diaporthe eres]
MSKGKGKQSEPPRRHHEPSQKHRRSSDTAHAPHEYEKFFPCMSNHRGCKWKSSGDIECDDGHLRTVSWQKCRKEDARAFLRQFNAPRIQEAAEAEPPPPQRGQAAQAQQAEQAQETRGEEAAAGPSSTHAPAAEAAQPVSQQEAGTSGGNTVPGPFGQPVPAPGVPTPPAQHMPFAQGVPGNAGMGYATGSQNMAGVPGTQSRGYSQDSRYPQNTAYTQNTAYPQETPFSVGYGDGGETAYASGYSGGHNMSFAGGYGGGYDMGFPDDYGQGEEILFSEDMPFDESYGGYEEIPITGGPVDDAGNFGPQSSTVVAPVEARAKWVATSRENLYHSKETDGVAKDRPYTAFKSVWTDLNYSKL